MRCKSSLALAFLLAAALPVHAQFVDAGGKPGAAIQMNAGAPGTTGSEVMSRQLIELRAQRDALAASVGKDSDQYRSLDLEISQLHQQIAYAQSAHDDDNAAADASDAIQLMPTFPRVVQVAPPPPSAPADPVPASAPAGAAPPATPAAPTPPPAGAGPGPWTEPPADLALRARLAQVNVTISAADSGLAKVLEAFHDQTNFNLEVNWRALEGAGVEKETSVTVNLAQVSAGAALRGILGQPATANLGFTVKDGVLIVSTKDDLNSSRYQVMRMYNVSDLLAISSVFQLTPEQLSRVYENRVTAFEDAIKSTVEPDSWRDNGGTIGSIKAIDGVFIINQTAESHHAIEQFLAQFRATRGH